MRVRGDNAPNNAFSVEAQPKKPGYVLVRFYADVQPFEEKDGDLTISGYEYDEYHLELQNIGNMAGYVLEHYAELMEKAISSERDGIPLSPAEKISALESENAALTERVAVLEDALCEVDGINEERLSALEDALCEMDEVLNGGNKL